MANDNKKVTTEIYKIKECCFTTSDQSLDSEQNVMSDEYKKSVAEIYIRQHEFYAAQTAGALQFPIKLILTLNAAAVAATLLLVRAKLSNGDNAMLIEAVGSAFWAFLAFGAGVSCVLVAGWFQWQLYSKIMHRKRKLLEEALTADSWNEAMKPFINEPSTNLKTSFQKWCFAFVVVSFGLFLFGVFLLMVGL